MSFKLLRYSMVALSSTSICVGTNGSRFMPNCGPHFFLILPVLGSRPPAAEFSPLTSSSLEEKVDGSNQGCQMAKFDPFLSWDCARVEGMGAQSKERK